MKFLSVTIAVILFAMVLCGQGNPSVGAIQIVSGNNQTTPVTQSFPAMLGVRVVDLQGNPAPNVALKWAVTSGTATLSSTSATTNVNGQGFAGLIAGSGAGAIVVSATSGALSVEFNLTATAAPNQIQVTPQALSFSYQSGAALPSGQRITVNSSTAGTPLNFAITATTGGGGNWLSVSASSGTTPAQITVFVNPAGLAAGAYSGRLTVGTAGVTVNLSVLPPSTSLGVITTIAGTDWSLPATSFPNGNAPLSTTNGVAIDAQGNIYFSDQSDSVVLRQAPDGAMRVIAGNGIVGFTGDGGQATSAALFLGPGYLTGDEFGLGGGVAVDQSGNVYVADTYNRRIRKISPDGIITTVAGNGKRGFSGDGGPARQASFNLPCAVAVDPAGNLYISDTNNDRIRKVTPDGIITTFAGGGDKSSLGDGGPATSASLNSPAGLAFDAKGNLYVADYENGLIRRISPDGTIASVAGNGANGGYLLGDGGPATKAELYFPAGVAVDTAGNLYIADSYNHSIREVTAADGIIHTVAGNSFSGTSGDGGPATSAKFYVPIGVGVDAAGNLYIADSFNERIRKVTPDAVVNTVAGNGNYKFSGDGGPATSATLNAPEDLAIDNLGNLIVADTGNNRIRKIDRNGRITTIAGNGNSDFGGEGTPAISAPVYSPTGLAIDADGNIFIASENCVVLEVDTSGTLRRIAGDPGPCAPNSNVPTGDGGPATSAYIPGPRGLALDNFGNLYISDIRAAVVRKVHNGVITTVAGTGKLGYSGDNGPATAATLRAPVGVATDAAGNLYIADDGNCVVRKVSVGGVITTVAGNGKCESTGDGGPAVQAGIGFPNGVSVDGAGNLYIADYNDRVRKVTPEGIITTIAGNGDFDFDGDGGLAVNAAVGDPQVARVDAAGNIYIADSFDRIRKILAQPPTAQASPAQLQFTASSGGAIAPAQNITFTGTIPDLAYTTQISPDAGWLSITPATGVSPSLIQVTADPSNLPPGNYSATITFAAPLAKLVSTTVTVSFSVSAGRPPTLSVDKSNLSFPYPSSGVARSQTVTVFNTGGGALQFTASAGTSAGGNWLSVSPSSAQATPSRPVSLAITANPAGLPPGAYLGTVLVDAGLVASSIPVTMTISNRSSALLLSQTGLSFTAIEKGGTVPPQNFGVLNLGSGLLSFSPDTSTATGGAWLSAASSPSGGATPTVNVSIDASALTSGRYYGLVKVNSPGAANSPQAVTALLEVLQQGTDIGALLQPNELTFNAVAGGPSPGSQTVLVYDITAQPKSFHASVSNGAIAILPTDATVAPNNPVSIVVQPLTDGMSVGTYPSRVTLQFDDGRVRTIAITVVVAPASGSSSSGSETRIAADGTCSPTELLPAISSLGNDFRISQGYPAALQVQVQDDCGNPLENGSVVAEFSNGDPPLSLISLKGGRWDATWQSNHTQSGVTVTVKARTPDGQVAGVKQVSGSFGGNSLPPVVAGVTDAASGMANRPLSPGTLIAITGDRLSDQSATAPAPPYGDTLANTRVLVAGQQLPLVSTDPSRITAIIPYGIEVNALQQVIVTRDDAYSQPVFLNLASTSPAIFVVNAAQGKIVDAYGQLVGPGNAAKAGDQVTIYCTGLGALQQPATAGAVGPDSSATINPVSVTIGGQDAAVSFSGLAPGLVGIYFVRVIVPSGIPPGDQVPVVITSLATPPVMSPTVTIAIQ